MPNFFFLCRHNFTNIVTGTKKWLILIIFWHTCRLSMCILTLFSVFLQKTFLRDTKCLFRRHHRTWVILVKININLSGHPAPQGNQVLGNIHKIPQYCQDTLWICSFWKLHFVWKEFTVSIITPILPPPSALLYLVLK